MGTKRTYILQTALLRHLCSLPLDARVQGWGEGSVLEQSAGGVTSEYPDKEKSEPLWVRKGTQGSVQRTNQKIAVLVCI